MRVKISVNGRNYQGKGISTDIIEAAAHAYLKALNKADQDRNLGIESSVSRMNPQL